jgi:hypothetical protein
MGALGTLVKVMIFGGFAASLGWVMFAATVPEADVSRPGGDFVQSRRRLSLISKAPVVKPRARELRRTGVVAAWGTSTSTQSHTTRGLKTTPIHPPTPPPPPLPAAAALPYREWVGDAYNLRGCQCLKDWEKQPANTPGLCRCEGVCPPHVNPPFLTEAKGQSLCSLEYQTGYRCQAVCQHTSENEEDDAVHVNWLAYPCGGGEHQEECDKPIHAARKKAREAAEANPPAAAAAEEEKKKAPEPAPEAAPPAKKADPPPPAPAKEKEKAEYTGPGALTWDPKDVWDLRGLGCEEKDGVEQCYYEDSQGRELCPPGVTHETLNAPVNQFLCSAEMAKQYYCTAACQSGNPELRWNAHEVSWCYAPANKGSCPPRPTPIPKADFKLKPWSEPPDIVLPCEAAAARGEKPPGIVKDLTFAVLTHEPRSLRDSLATYEANGLFGLTNEFLIYVNGRKPEIDAEIAPYVKKYPKTVRIMGDAGNHGILRGMNWLTGNSSNPYFLFLERDFQLIEPATCVYEQLTAGVEMVKAKTAHVVRYRSRRHAGHPNWAELMFRGHEDDVFKGHQPNLFCNHYYWVPDPDKRWPDKMWICREEPQMYCSDSYYCNWTNNPQIWSIDWWNKEYVAHFDEFKRNDPYYDIEAYTCVPLCARERAGGERRGGGPHF